MLVPYTQIKSTQLSYHWDTVATLHRLSEWVCLYLVLESHTEFILSLKFRFIAYRSSKMSWCYQISRSYNRSIRTMRYILLASIVSKTTVVISDASKVYNRAGVQWDMHPLLTISWHHHRHITDHDHGITPTRRREPSDISWACMLISSALVSRKRQHHRWRLQGIS
jgi:hypothetical protein